MLAVSLALLGFVAAQPANDPYHAAPANVSQPVLLKLNYNYLLFTYPVAPYRDQSGSVMVPLRVVGELMGGQVYTSDRRKAGMLIRPTLEESHLLEFIAGAQQAYVDEKPIRLASTPIWLDAKDELLVPLDPLIETFGLRPRWNRRTNVLELNSDLFESFVSFELETLPDGYQDTEQLVPSDVALTRQGPGARQIGLSMNLENVSNSSVSAGQQGVFLLAQYGGVAGAIVKGRDTSVATIGPNPKDPCCKGRGRELFVCREAFPAFYGASNYGISGNYPMEYLIARVRLRLPSAAR